MYQFVNNYDRRLVFGIDDHLGHLMDLRVVVDGAEPLFRASDSYITINPRFVTDNLANVIVAKFRDKVVDGQPTRVAGEAVLAAESGALAHFDHGRLRVFARSLETAWAIHDQIVSAYRESEAAPSKAFFQIIKPGGDGYTSREVEVRRSAEQTASELRLHYGSDFLAWKERFIGLLNQGISGIHLFRGEPGTGKTSFIRHLICELKSSHRFFFLPSYEYYRVGNSALIDFFHEEQEANPNIKLVLIMEDAEAVLMPRGTDNGFSVSALLNMSDGLLGDGLNLHIICTVNCELSELDPAVVRPGRLRSAREFTFLSYEQALELARYRGMLSPPQRREYSIAEIYNLAQTAAADFKSKTIGFRSAET